MINIKGGTQTWSSAAKTTSDFKPDNTQSVSAVDKEKYFQNEAIGDTLNKVADPNWTDTSKKLRATGDASMGKDAFMTLLLTQMKNQDPTNPLKSHEMAAQLAQFTSLEKLNNINEAIDNLRKDNQPTHNFQALAMIGKTITLDNSKISRSAVEERHPLNFMLPGDATTANIEIKDANGATVRTMEMKNLKAGRNDLNWNGDSDEGKPAAVGDYTMSVSATGSNGRKMQVETRAEGIVTGVNFTAKGPQLMMGGRAVSMSEVKNISDDSLMPAAGQAASPGLTQQMQQMLGPQMGSQNNQPVPQAAPAPAARKTEVKPETKDLSKADAAKRARLNSGSVNDSAMTQDLINVLNKQGAKAGMGT